MTSCCFTRGNTKFRIFIGFENPKSGLSHFKIKNCPFIEYLNILTFYPSILQRYKCAHICSGHQSSQMIILGDIGRAKLRATNLAGHNQVITRGGRRVKTF